MSIPAPRLPSQQPRQRRWNARQTLLSARDKACEDVHTHTVKKDASRTQFRVSQGHALPTQAILEQQNGMIAAWFVPSTRCGNHKVPRLGICVARGAHLDATACPSLSPRKGRELRTRHRGTPRTSSLYGLTHGIYTIHRAQGATGQEVGSKRAGPRRGVGPRKPMKPDPQTGVWRHGLHRSPPQGQLGCPPPGAWCSTAKGK